MYGYNELTRLIIDKHDLGIFRRFMFLNVRNLLRLQAELVDFDVQFRNIIERDAASGDAERTQFQYSFRALRGKNGSARSPDHALQYSKTLEVAPKLREYNEALAHVKYLMDLSPAIKQDLKALRTWLSRPDGGNHFLKSREFTTWSEKTEEDLTSLTERYKDKDSLFRFLDGTVIPFIHEKFWYKHHDRIDMAEKGMSPSLSPLHYYSESYIAAFVDGLSAIISILLIMVAVFSLYFIHNPIARMGAMLAFTSLFGAIFTLVSKARRTDCFLATAAFASIQVVFVGGVNCASG